MTINRMGSMMTTFFNPGPVTDYSSAKKSDAAMFAGFFRELLERGVYFPPSQFESLFVSTAHTEDDIDFTVRSAAEAFRVIRAGR